MMNSTILTSKEQQVAKQIFIQHSAENIASAVGISKKTVEHHLSSIRRKMHEKNSFGAALKAYYLGHLNIDTHLFN
jgi:DNA-binding CsgD family transcriptional regulator